MVTEGVTITEAPDKLPGCQVYATAPLALSVELLPAQIVAGLAVTDTFGAGFTIMVTTAVLVAAQPKVLLPLNEYVVVIEGVTTIEVAVEAVLQV